MAFLSWLWLTLAMGIITMGFFFQFFQQFWSPANPSKKSGNDNKQAIEFVISKFRDQFLDVPEVNAENVDLSDSNFVLLDAREPKEQNVSMITGAIPKQVFEKSDIRYSGKKIIVYCTAGYRSSIFARSLLKDGFDAYSLRGGILFWAHADKPVSNQAGPTRKVHTNGANWNLLPSGWQATW